MTLACVLSGTLCRACAVQVVDENASPYIDFNTERVGINMTAVEEDEAMAEDNFVSGLSTTSMNCRPDFHPNLQTAPPPVALRLARLYGPVQPCMYSPVRLRATTVSPLLRVTPNPSLSSFTAGNLATTSTPRAWIRQRTSALSPPLLPRTPPSRPPRSGATASQRSTATSTATCPRWLFRRARR